MNDPSAVYDELPRTAYLDHTLRRARNAAEQRSHRYVTLDHLMLALLDDPDAIKLLKAVGADIAIIQATITHTLNGRMAALVDPSGRPPGFSYKFDTLFTGVAEDAIRAGRKEIDGALALIGVAREPESYAAEILRANGFRLDAALGALGRASEPQQVRKAEPVLLTPAHRAAVSALAPLPQPKAPRPASASQAADGEILVEDMLATVRNILDDEERKDKASRPASQAIRPPPAPPPLPAVPRAAQPRLEPPLRVADDGKRGPAPGVRAAPLGQERLGTAPGAWVGSPPAPPRPITQPPQQPAGFAEPPAPAFDLELPPAPQQAAKKMKSGKPKPGRGSGEPAGPLAKLLENIPRKARLAKGELIQIRLGKEETAQLFARAPRRNAPAAEGLPACRAVTMRLSAPEGGFFIETAAPETQWIVNRQAGAGEEPFGTWGWAVVPNETGSYHLSLTISARDFDAKGLPTEIRLPEQTVKIRIRGNLGRMVWGLFRSLLLVAIGSGLTVGAWYLLKALGKLPH